VGLVVQKYGGSSVADADCIKRVAQRVVATRKAGHDVVIVISAMGDTTDELMDLAQQISPIPPPRELDMLLTAGERMSAALLAMAIANLGHQARSFTGSQAGVITTSKHGNARIIDVTPGRITEALGQGHIAIVAGFQGVSQDTKDITTMGRGASDSAAKIRAASPTLSGTPTTVILASLRSCATPEMMACSMMPPSVGSWTTQVPSSWLNDERTWIGML
jgi:aspartate kinase